MHHRKVKFTSNQRRLWLCNMGYKAGISKCDPPDNSGISDLIYVDGTEDEDVNSKNNTMSGGTELLSETCFW